MYCENCGTSVEAGSKFCSACGNKIKADESSPRGSLSNFTDGRRRNASYKVQTIIVISIAALLLIIVMAWLTIPSSLLSTRRAEEQSAPKSDSNIKSLLEAEWNKDSYTIPLGNFAVLGGSPFGSPDVDESKGTISTNRYKELIAWEKVGLVTVRHDQQYEKFRRGGNFSWDQWLELKQ